MQVVRFQSVKEGVLKRLNLKFDQFSLFQLCARYYMQVIYLLSSRSFTENYQSPQIDSYVDKLCEVSYEDPPSSYPL